MGRTLLLLFGANNPSRKTGGAYQLLEISAHIHLIGLLLAAAGLAAAIITFFTIRVDRVTQIIVAATAATIAAGIFGTVVPDLAHAHEVAILLPFGAALAARMLPPLVPARWLPGRAAAIALAAWLAAGLAALCIAASATPVPLTNESVASWLVAHHYTDGLAGYWQSNATTVDTGGQVMVAPITNQASRPWHWESAAVWYEPSQRRANFVIAIDSTVEGGGVSPAAARHAFGRPAHQYQIGDYVVMVYDYNLLTRLG
jgi:hypothetical protein